MKKLLLTFALVTICKAQSPSPTMLQYLQNRMVAIYGGTTSQGTTNTGIYPQLVLQPFPIPIFAPLFAPLDDIAFGQIGVIQGTGAIFSTLQAEAMADSYCLLESKQSPPYVAIEVSALPWLDNETVSQNMRTEFTAVLNYMLNTSTACSGLKINIVMGTNWENIANAYTSNAQTTQSCGELTSGKIASVAQITYCEVTQTFSWLGNVSLFTYAASGFGATGFVPYKFTLWHELTNTNTTYGFDGVTQGTPAQWATFAGAAGTAVHTVLSTTPIGIAYANTDSTTMISTVSVASGSNITYVGFDLYDDDFQGSGDMETTYNHMQTAKGLSNVTSIIMNELWMTAWTPTGESGDGNAYEGVGNCDWVNQDIIRQELTAQTIWSVWAGVTEVHWYNLGYTSTLCVWGPPGNNQDKTTSQVYEQNVANKCTGTYPGTNPPCAQTKGWFFFQKLIGWFGILQSGIQLPL